MCYSSALAFGSSKERKLFPLYYGSDRLGIKMQRQDAPHLGPGCYDNHEYGTILDTIKKKPQSKRGYALSARTAARFPPLNKTATPSPQQYQKDQSKSEVLSPGKTPFNSTTSRFKSSTDSNPGPGMYTLDGDTNRKVSWPMCFGRPDWTALPQPENKSLRVMLTSEKEFIKQRNRVAYLSLYY
uniref:Si:ch211-66i15.4 n=1 Tax=Salarias fasciatus TaxID=181472 RepID=A0A672IMA3_SALFA